MKNLVTEAGHFNWFVFPAKERNGQMTHLITRPNLPGRDEMLVSEDGTTLWPTCSMSGPTQTGREAIQTITEYHIPEGPELAMAFVERYGSIDGSHHKQWVLDQVVRALLNCPRVKHVDDEDEDHPGYAWFELGESEDYDTWCQEHEAWDFGLAP
jgi:hypothetical protein